MNNYLDLIEFFEEKFSPIYSCGFCPDKKTAQILSHFGWLAYVSLG